MTKPQTQTKSEPQRHVDYQLYPPSSTSDGKGWAVTIGGEYVKVAPFKSRSDAEAYAKSESLKRRQIMKPQTQPKASATAQAAQSAEGVDIRYTETPYPAQGAAGKEAAHTPGPESGYGAVTLTADQLGAGHLECADALRETAAERDRLREQVKELQAMVEDARTVIRRGVLLMTTKQLGKWAGVRTWQEQESESDYASNDCSELLEACKVAADWFSRSARIDDQEQAQDLRAAIAKAEKGKQ